MAQRFHLDEDYQLPAKIMRAVIWSGAMAALAFLPYLLTEAVVFAIASRTAELPNESWLGWLFLVPVVLVGVVSTLLFALMGMIASLKAPAGEPFWAPRAMTFQTWNQKSRFLRWFLFVGCMTVALASFNIAYSIVVSWFYLSMLLVIKMKREKAARF